MNRKTTAVEDEGVNHSSFNIAMFEKLLNGADIVAGPSKCVANEWWKVWQPIGFGMPGKRFFPLSGIYSINFSIKKIITDITSVQDKFIRGTPVGKNRKAAAFVLSEKVLQTI